MKIAPLIQKALLLSLGLSPALTTVAVEAKKSRAASLEVIDLKTPPSKDEVISTVKPDLLAAAAKIDELIGAKLTEEKLQPHALVTDDVFLRRVYLDVIGRVPTKAEALQFLDSKEENKRSQLINKLLSSEGYVQHYFNFWADVLRIKNGIAPGGQGREAGAAYIQWLKQALRGNKPYDQLVRELLTADGASYANGATGFYMRDMGMPLDNMAVTTQIFLGTQMVCAQCHDHPFDKWTQMDYYQMAAHSNGMTGSNAIANQADVERYMRQQGIVAAERKVLNKAFSDILFRLRFNHVYALDRQLKLPSDYQYKDAKPNAVITPMIPAAFAKDGKIASEGEAPILAYAQWMTSRENPRFTLVAANRLWKKLLGLGVIDPVDELTDSTIPSNPALMEHLERTLKAVNYNMKDYLRVVLNSKTYQREAHPEDVEPGAAYHFPGPVLRRMSAEQIWDSIVALTKDNPDEASHAGHLETMQMLTKIEWMDRTIQTLTPEQLIAGARKIADYQQELSMEMQTRGAALKQGMDEAAIREARDAAKNQRTRVYDKSDELVFNEGFREFAEKVSKNPGAVAKETDVDFARQVAAAVKHYKRIPTMDEALDFTLQEQRESYQAWLAARSQREMLEWKINTPEKTAAYKKFAEFREKSLVRAADLRNPAPNGHFLRQYGQSDRELVDNSSRDASVMQSLTMMNGSLFRMMMHSCSLISREMRETKGADEVLDTIYLSTFARKATAEEKETLRPILEASGSEGRGDVLWTVLNTRQFLFIQ